MRLNINTYNDSQAIISIYVLKRLDTLVCHRTINLRPFEGWDYRSSFLIIRESKSKVEGNCLLIYLSEYSIV